MTLPVVEPPAAEPERTATVAGVLLAAGESDRFGGENKLLVEIDGVPLVRRAAESLLASRVASVTVVVGHEGDRVRDAVSELAVDVASNPRYAEGQATSVSVGVESVPETDAIVFALGDMPNVAPDSVNALIDAYRAGAGDALAAAYRGTRGNPVLFGAVHAPELAEVDGDVGGREILLRGDASALVETGDPGVLEDVDVPPDVEG